MATKKTENKELEKQATESKIPFDQKLLNQIKQLEGLVEKSAKELQQYLGALDFAKVTYQEYMKEIEKNIEEVKE